MGSHTAPAPAAPRRRGRRLLGMLLGLLVTALTTALASWALVVATATGTAEPVSTGTVSLRLADNGAGFSTPVSGLLPADTVLRYVELTNDGAVPGSSLSLTVTGAVSNTLVTSPTKGLTVAVDSCPAAWAPGPGTCSGGSTPLLATTPVATLASTPQLLLGSMPAGAVAHLRVVLALPDQAETTLNGAPPAGTVQGLANQLTYSFTMNQRAGTTTGG